MKTATSWPRRAALLAMAAAGAGPAGAQPRAEWPTQPVRYINLYAPGGSTDILSRLWCHRMSLLTGQQYVIEARTGAGGTVGQAAIARAAPDGYTIGLGSIATLAIGPSLYPTLGYDPARDFTLISGLWRLPNLLIVNNDLPARSVPELIALLKQAPGRYSFGSGGSGTTVHLAGEMFKQQAGVEMVHVPFRGEAAAMVDMLAGRVQMVFGNIPSAIAQVRDGKARALAVTGLERSPVASEVPTLAETLPGFDITSWNGVVGPPGLPPAVLARLMPLTAQALADPALVRSFLDNGAVPWSTTPEEFARFRAAEERRFAEVIRISGAKAD
jgi:tripartite-type tricarboxylate transporter receptor subunit TctC